jgi:dipeptidyl aminopeptidase/acylaminoacyl peptidase
MRPRLTAFCLAGLCCLLPEAGPAAEATWTTPLIPRTQLFAGLKYSLPLVSPDGTKLAYLAPEQGRMNIWVRSLGRRDDHPITAYADHGIRFMQWRYDSQSLIFFRDEGGNEHYEIYQVGINGMSKKVLPAKAAGFYNLILSPKSPDEALVQLRSRDSAYYLYKINLNSGALTPLEPAKGQIWADNDFQARAEASGLYGLHFRSKDASSGNWHDWFNLGVDDSFKDILGFSGDGNSAYVASSLDSDTIQLVQMDLSGNGRRIRSSDPNFDLESALFDPSTHELEAAAFDGQRRIWKFYSPRAEADFKILSATHMGDIRVFSRDQQGRFWTLAYMQPEAPTAYYIYDRKQAWAGPLFPGQPGLETYHLASMRDVSFTARDGMKLYAYLSLPQGLTPKNLPLVLLVHGGPWARDHWDFNPEVQWLCNRGYAVLQVNYRGSTGFGKKYFNAGNQEWGGKMSTDLIDGKRWAVSQGYADANRVAIFGSSYGGYAALAGLAFSPKEFACGVDICGPSSLQTLFAELTRYHDWIGATLIDRRVGRTDWQQNLLRSRSPLNAAAAFEAPVFIAQGENDQRVPRRESDQMAEALRRLGKKVYYEVFPDEGHGFEKWENQMALNEKVEAFLAAYLGGRTEAADFGSADNADSVSHYSRNLAVNQAAAAAGKTSAMLAMGDRYVFGNGVDKSASLALQWYQSAAAKGDQETKDRLRSWDRIQSKCMDQPLNLKAAFSDFSNRDGDSNWGEHWFNYQDDDHCGSETFFPPKGHAAVDTATTPESSGLAGHFSGHMGDSEGHPGANPWASLLCDFLPGSLPLDFAKAGLPTKGLRCMMLLGSRHPKGKQDYVIALHRFSITPVMDQYKGDDYALKVRGDSLSPYHWTEVKADFPPRGTVVIQPSDGFAQADWTPKAQQVPWDTDDLFRIDFNPVVRGQDFDFYVKDVGFY